MCHSILYLLIICFITSPISELSKVNLFPSHSIALGESSVDFFYLFLWEIQMCHDVDLEYWKCVVIYTFILYLYFIWYQLYQV